MSVNRYMPSAREAALLVLALLDELKGDRDRVTRARLGGVTLQRLWNRPRVRPEFFRDVQDWMHLAGWALFDAGQTYAAVRIDAVENWPAVSSKRMRGILEEVVQGTFDFSELDTFLTTDVSPQ